MADEDLELKKALEYSERVVGPNFITPEEFMMTKLNDSVSSLGAGITQCISDALKNPKVMEIANQLTQNQEKQTNDLLKQIADQIAENKFLKMRVEVLETEAQKNKDKNKVRIELKKENKKLKEQVELYHAQNLHLLRKIAMFENRKKDYEK